MSHAIFYSKNDRTKHITVLSIQFGTTTKKNVEREREKSRNLIIFSVSN